MPTTRSDLYTTKDRGYFGAVKRSVFNRVKDKNFGRVLDIGGGDGASAQFVVAQGFASSVFILDPYAEFEATAEIDVSDESADDLSLYERFRDKGSQFDTVFGLMFRSICSIHGKSSSQCIKSSLAVVVF